MLSQPCLRDRLLGMLIGILAPTEAGEGSPDPQQAMQQASPDGPAGGDMHILLAEDNSVNQMLAVRLLEKIGYRVDVVENGLDAVDRVRRRRYDLVLMDCQMPEMDGYQATAEIRRLAADQRHTNIIAVTANAMLGDPEKCLKAGMDAYLSKLIQLAQLKNVLDRWSRVASGKEDEPLTQLDRASGRRRVSPKALTRTSRHQTGRRRHRPARRQARGTAIPAAPILISGFARTPPPNNTEFFVKIAARVRAFLDIVEARDDERIDGAAAARAVSQFSDHVGSGQPSRFGADGARSTPRMSSKRPCCRRMWRCPSFVGPAASS